MKIKNVVIAGICLLLISPSLSMAASPRVGAPYVEKKVTRGEWQGFYAVDDDSNRSDAWKQRLSLTRGFTDFWKSGIRTSFERSGYKGEEMNFISAGFDNTFQLTEKGEYFVDVGMKIDYEHFFEEKTRMLLARNCC